MIIGVSMRAFLYILLSFIHISCVDNSTLIPTPISSFEKGDTYNFAHRMRIEIKNSSNSASNGLSLKGRVERKLVSKGAYSKTISLDFYLNDIDWGLEVLDPKEKTNLLSSLGRKFNVTFTNDGRLESIEFAPKASSFVRQVIYKLVTPLVFKESSRETAMSWSSRERDLEGVAIMNYRLYPGKDESIIEKTSSGYEKSKFKPIMSKIKEFKTIYTWNGKGFDSVNHTSHIKTFAGPLTTDSYFHTSYTLNKGKKHIAKRKKNHG